MKSVLSTARESLKLLELISARKAREKSRELVAQPLKKVRLEVKRFTQSAFLNQESNQLKIEELQLQLVRVTARLEKLELEILGHEAPHFQKSSLSETAPPIFPLG